MVLEKKQIKANYKVKKLVVVDHLKNYLKIMHDAQGGNA